MLCLFLRLLFGAAPLARAFAQSTATDAPACIRLRPFRPPDSALRAAVPVHRRRGVSRLQLASEVSTSRLPAAEGGRRGKGRSRRGGASGGDVKVWRLQCGGGWHTQTSVTIHACAPVQATAGSTRNERASRASLRTLSKVGLQAVANQSTLEMPRNKLRFGMDCGKWCNKIPLSLFDNRCVYVCG